VSLFFLFYEVFELHYTQGRTYGLKAQLGVIGGVLTGFVTGIRKDSVRRWNLWFPSAGVFAELLAGRATGTQITFSKSVIKRPDKFKARNVRLSNILISI